MSYTVSEIARHIQGQPLGDDSLLIREVSSIEAAREGSLVFAENEGFFQKAEVSQASCIIAAKAQRSSLKTLILVDSPRLAFAKVLNLYHLSSPQGAETRCAPVERPRRACPHRGWGFPRSLRRCR
ncbi:MAG: LpxD N-terminal domain-containing protein [Candidatus Methylomirabilales bacterium]